MTRGGSLVRSNWLRVRSIAGEPQIVGAGLGVQVDVDGECRYMKNGAVNNTGGKLTFISPCSGQDYMDGCDLRY